MLSRFNIWISLPITFFAAIVVMMLSSGHSLCAQELNASDRAAGDQFGESVSSSGNIGLVGASTDSAYLFRNLDTAEGTVTESARLRNSNGVEFDFLLGESGVSLSGNIGLIGSRDDESAYLFRNLDTATGTVNESAVLFASDGDFGDSFGQSVSLSGNTGLVGADFGEGFDYESGSAFLFRNLDTATGSVDESAILLASDGAERDGFGTSVSLSGNTGLIGAPGDDDDGPLSGSAYLFRNLDTATGTRTQSAKLHASDAAEFDQFGCSVSLSGNTGLVGAIRDIATVPAAEGGFESALGSAYLFRNLDTATGTRTQSAILRNSDGERGGEFGSTVSLSGNTALIGARFGPFSAYLFRNLDTATGTVNESVRLRASESGGNFGISVSLDGDRFTVGAHRARPSATGTAYTGTVSSVTTLDFGNTSAIIDGISFQSCTDWIIGETTSNNHVELTQGDSAGILELGTGIFVGANADSNDNSLTISGSVTAATAEIGAAGNVDNQLILNSTGTSAIGTLSLHANNSLLIEGEFTTFDLLDTELGSTNLFAVLDGDSQLITDLNFDTLLRTSFDSTTGYTTFTVITATGPPPITRGDVNLDGVVNFLDISPFIRALTMGKFQAQADLNDDGIVNFLDISPFIIALTGGGV